MTAVMRMILWLFTCLLRDKAELGMEICALRQQLTIYKRTVKKPKIADGDRRWFGIWSRLHERWRDCLIIVQPETVLKWHRRAFRWYWRFKSRPGPGRPRISLELKNMIIRLSMENRLWSATRIRDELKLLGWPVCKSTVEKYMAIRRAGGSPQNWRTFIRNHMKRTAAMDFFVVYTLSFRLLYVLVVMSHDRRRIAHFGVTDHPTEKWTARRMNEAFPYDTAPKYLVRDRDGIYGSVFRDHVRGLGIEERVTSRKSPWQNAYCERLIGTLRRECLDHVLILNDKHLARVLREYADYYNNNRTHQSLNGNSPSRRELRTCAPRGLNAEPVLGGLHHQYRIAA